jgi:hypothetical protein
MTVELVADRYSTTPDGRYFIVRGRLRRRSNPELTTEERDGLVKAPMSARRAVGAAKRVDDAAAEATARQAVDQAKQALGERGPVWWNDDAPDFNRKLAQSTPIKGRQMSRG